MCKAHVRRGLRDELAVRLTLSKPQEIDKSSLETDNRSSISLEFNFEIDLPGKRYLSTIYCLNLMKLFRRKREWGNLRESQLHLRLPPDRCNYLRMVKTKKKERFHPEPGTISLRQKDINLVTGKPFKIKTCCSSQMLINSLREDTEYLLDLGVNGMGQSNRTLPVVWLGRGNRYPYLRIKCIKYRNLNQVTRAESYLLLKRESFVEKNNAAS
ncbi:uncharacterized protein TNCV_4152641 [Trichonephila clavipes]|nr:uncharacterized protein TNCV_4152641 [Trichonephila clavipes]